LGAFPQLRLIPSEPPIRGQTEAVLRLCVSAISYQNDLKAFKKRFRCALLTQTSWRPNISLLDEIYFFAVTK
jgi:hypothetical protein